MFDGSNGGRGFEMAASPWIWGGLCVLAAVLWLVFELGHRRRQSKNDDDEVSDT